MHSSRDRLSLAVCCEDSMDEMAQIAISSSKLCEEMLAQLQGCSPDGPGDPGGVPGVCPPEFGGAAHVKRIL